MSAESGGEQAKLGDCERVRMKTDVDEPTIHKPDPFISRRSRCGAEFFEHATMTRREAEQEFEEVHECQTRACYGDQG